MGSDPAHSAGAVVDGRVVRVGFDNLEIECRVMDPHHGDQWSAALFLYLSGGRLGGRPIFASISGYHDDSVEQAVSEGACMWACAFGPVLVSALTGVPDPEARHDDVVIGDRRWRVVHSTFDRWLPPEGVAGEMFGRELRERLGGRPGFTPDVAAVVPAELLTGRDASLLSVFVMEGFGQRTVELKVNGVDTGLPWPVDAPPATDANGMVLLRELAVLVPLDEPVRSMPSPQALDRPGLEAVLTHLGGIDGPGQVGGWRGWRTHGGRLGPVIPEATMATFESVIGALPPDYRRFLTEVAGAGAGPGYGLLPPRRIRDVVPLAQAGCNAVWLLRVGGTDHGSVWVDSRPIDGRRHRIADSFTDWYRAWLDHALTGRGSWTHWDPKGCVGSNGAALEVGVPDVASRPRTAAGVPDLSGVITRLSVAGWNDYLPPPDGTFTLDPCQGCAEGLARYNLPEDVFARGALSRARKP